MQQNKLTPIERALLIKSEKRRRVQVYNTIDYFLNISNFMSFYSKDLIKILSYSHIWSHLKFTSNEDGLKNIDQKEIQTEDILYSFILSESNLQKILIDYNLNFDNLSEFFENTTSPKKESILSNFSFSKINLKIKSFINKISSKKKDGEKNVIEWKEKPKFSKEALLIFEKSLLNAIDRFKTPVITPEIFFITLMESKNCKASKIIKKILPRESDWYMLRYKLIKNIHFEESHVRNDIIRNQKYFGYLLKSRLSQLEFSRLIDLDLLGLAVSYFRTKLLKKALQINLLAELQKDILISAKVNKRKYSKDKLKRKKSKA